MVRKYISDISDKEKVEILYEVLEDTDKMVKEIQKLEKRAMENWINTFLKSAEEKAKKIKVIKVK